MQFGLTQEQEMFRQMAADVAKTAIAPKAAEVDQTGEFPWHVVDAYRQQDIYSLTVPEEYGGAGVDLLTFCVVVEEIAKVDATAAIILAVQELGLLPILLGGSEEQKQKYLPGFGTGELIAAFGLTEPEAGSDVSSLKMKAVRKGDKYVLNGTKVFITNGGIADVYSIFAVTDPEAKHRGISAFIVEKDTPGFSIGKIEDKMGIRGSQTAELIFENCEVPVENLIGQEGDGFKLAMMTLDRTRPGVAAQAVGIAQGAFDYAVQYVQDRKQFGKPLAAFQGLQFMLADMATQIESARQLLYKAASLIEAEGKDGKISPYINRYAAMAKLHAAETAMKVTTDAVQILGGYGYIKDHPVERMMRDAKITQIYEGTSQIQKIVIARSYLD